MAEHMTGGQLVVDMLDAFGIDCVFGVPGGQTLAITDAIINHPRIRFVTARHEGAAAVMADAYGRLTGRPGVCLATTGPGATNLLTGVGGALRDSSPVLVLTCNNNSENIYRDDTQSADHVQLFRPLTKDSKLIVHGSGIRSGLEEAYVRAMSGNPGPVHIDFTRDSIGEVIPAVAIPAVHPAIAWVTARPRPNAEAVAAAAALLAQAERPVLWLGNGCNRGRAGRAAMALAEDIQAPIVTTFNGTGCVPSTHSHVFGPLSRMGTNLSSRVIAESDLVIAVGNSLNAISTSRWKLDLPRIIHVDIDPEMIGRYYGDRTFGVIGDAEATLTELLASAQSEAPPFTRDRREWIAELAQHRDAWWAATALTKDSMGSPGAHGPLSPADIVRSLREIAPDETLLIPDAGNPGVWSYLWEIRQIGTYIKPVGFGNMGFAVPAAIAAAVIDPERPVLALVGDGSLGMSMAELETLARVGGRVAVVILNDNGYGNIRQEQEIYFPGRTIGVDFGECNYAQVASGLGVFSQQIDSLGELSKAVGEALRSGRPALFDVPIDRAVNAWTFPPFAQFTSPK